MKKLKAFYIAPLIAVLAVPAFAGPRHGEAHFDKRLDRHETRIDRGVSRGDLTRHEASKLRKQHQRVERMYNRFERNGHLNHREKRRLQAALDKNSKKIYRLKHNDRQRWPYAKHGKRHDHRGHRDYHQHAWSDHDRYRSGDNFWSFVIGTNHRW